MVYLIYFFQSFARCHWFGAVNTSDLVRGVHACASVEPRETRSESREEKRESLFSRASSVSRP